MVRRRLAEGSLLWQFPGGEIEDGESALNAAAREVAEETGLTVKPLELLGEREHPITSRHMFYVACSWESGSAYVADEEELAEVAWCDLEGVRERVPGGLWGPVQAHLDRLLTP